MLRLSFGVRLIKQIVIATRRSQFKCDVLSSFDFDGTHKLDIYLDMNGTRMIQRERAS